MQLALFDLRRGIDGYSDQPLKSGLSGYPPVIYCFLEMRIVDIAYAVCPDDFAREIEQEVKQIEES